MNAAALAAFALLPMMLGQLPAQASQLTLRLCAGGSIVLPLDRRDKQDEAPCAAKGCHAASCRKSLVVVGKRSRDGN